ncbi:hypothetical protein E2320_022395 [Naja naja]|nr:hypothetical protein E2320_022395 [Naja naja]
MGPEEPPDPSLTSALIVATPQNLQAVSEQLLIATYDLGPSVPELRVLLPHILLYPGDSRLHFPAVAVVVNKELTVHIPLNDKLGQPLTGLRDGGVEILHGVGGGAWKGPRGGELGGFSHDAV